MMRPPLEAKPARLKTMMSEIRFLIEASHVSSFAETYILRFEGRAGLPLHRDARDFLLRRSRHTRWWIPFADFPPFHKWLDGRHSYRLRCAYFLPNLYLAEVLPTSTWRTDCYALPSCRFAWPLQNLPSPIGAPFRLDPSQFCSVIKKRTNEQEGENSKKIFRRSHPTVFSCT
jgi:hypothetical protein